MRWDDKRLQVSSDTAWRAQYRLLQSWYRENVLKAEAGLGSRRGEDADQSVGSMLSAAAVSACPSLNFLSDEIAAYAFARAEQVQQRGGSIEIDRLRRNMLSSMPLCFNLFGHLRQHTADTAEVLRSVLNLDIARIRRIEVEEAPPPEEHLGDRTAFDAFVEYETTAGESGFLGIETKYTEPFSAPDYSLRRTIYAERTADPANGFRAGAFEQLRKAATNQLWRNVLLALSLRSRGSYRFGYVVVLACRGDDGAEAAVAGLREWHTDADSLLRSAGLEDLLDACAQREALKPWADRFRQRYLDLTPVNAHR